MLRQGENPNDLLEQKHKAEAEKAEAEAIKQKVKGLTIRDGFAKHIERGQKPGTVRGYQKVINAHLKDWLDKPLIGIQQSDVEALFDEIHRKSPSSCACDASFESGFQDCTNNLWREDARAGRT